MLIEKENKFLKTDQIYYLSKKSGLSQCWFGVCIETTTSEGNVYRLVKGYLWRGGGDLTS